MGSMLEKSGNENLFIELSALIEQSKRQVAIVANGALTVLFWQLGKRINEEILNKERAEYAKAIVSTLATQLQFKYGKNFEERNLRRMIQFAEQFSDFEIVVPLARQLSWSHFIELLPLKSTEAKMYYAQIAANGRGQPD